MRDFAQRLLQCPHRPPAAGSSEAWGKRIVMLALPGGPYRFCGLNRTQEQSILERMGSFAVKPVGSTPAIDTLIFKSPKCDGVAFELNGREYRLDVQCAPGSVRIAGLDFVARLDWQPGLGGGFWTAVSEPERFVGAFENYFRALVSYGLLERGGVLIHSAGVVSEGGAYLFPGRSGSGKTTLSRLSLQRGRRVLSDDLNALTAGRDGPVVEQLPFTGELGAISHDLDSYPLHAICRIDKGQRHALRWMSRAETVASLAACSPNVNENPHRQNRLLRTLDALVRNTPSYVLTFHRDGGFWDLLDEVL